MRKPLALYRDCDDDDDGGGGDIINLLHADCREGGRGRGDGRERRLEEEERCCPAWPDTNYGLSSRARDRERETEREEEETESNVSWRRRGAAAASLA